MFNDVSEIVYTNINAWVVAYYKMTACRIIVTANVDFKDEKAIRQALTTESNTMLRKVSKFKDILTHDDYVRTTTLIKDLHEDTYKSIIKSLYQEGVM